MHPTLLLAAVLLGLAGMPHCAAMCGAACAAVVGPGGQGGAAARLGFQAARLAGYAAAGALVASGVNLLSALGHAGPALRPLWSLAHAGALALGLWLLWRGRQPAWLEGLARLGERAAPQAVPAGWQRVRGPARAVAAGGLWVAWPCGLLQSALVLAMLADTAAGGAAVMAAFAAASGTGLVVAPWLWRRLRAAGGAAVGLWVTRAAGALLVAASAWALVRGAWPQVAAYCGL
ncbi:MAG: sulfite exporter TauE/SafE family protein [Burkholderiales bacterium]|nr:sulfite exporter TauE/SafE family protein [Burkholderiales bacterium]